MANIYLHTRFDKNIFIGDRDVAKKSNPRWQRLAAAILNFYQA